MRSCCLYKRKMNANGHWGQGFGDPRLVSSQHRSRANTSALQVVRQHFFAANSLSRVLWMAETKKVRNSLHPAGAVLRFDRLRNGSHTPASPVIRSFAMWQTERGMVTEDGTCLPVSATARTQRFPRMRAEIVIVVALKLSPRARFLTGLGSGSAATRDIGFRKRLGRPRCSSWD